jgi:hypothetical protein
LLGTGKLEIRFNVKFVEDTAAEEEEDDIADDPAAAVPINDAVHEDMFEAGDRALQLFYALRTKQGPGIHGLVLKEYELKATKHSAKHILKDRCATPLNCSSS